LTHVERLVKSVLAGDKRAIARSITLIEDKTPEAADLLKALEPHTGRAYVVGITGPTGVGKSTLIRELVEAFRQRGLKVGVVAVDPTSPFTGGAILGDRLRMQEFTLDPGVFIRSMATRESVGGIAEATEGAVKVLDAAGYDVILVETVGAGQLDVGVAGIAHTVVLVLAPGLGDEVQVIKAGLMEIADIYVVNQADRVNADRMVADITSVLNMEPQNPGWKPPIVKTVALTGEGVEELVEQIERHRAFLAEGGIRLTEKKARALLVEALTRTLLSDLLPKLMRTPDFEAVTQEIAAGHLTAGAGAKLLIRRLLKAVRGWHEGAP